MIQKFRKKPVVIDAMKFTEETKEQVLEWLKSNDCVSYYVRDGHIAPTLVLRIKTLEGVMTATEGDWIIRGVQGEFYPCKPDIFAETYEEVSK